MRREVRAKRASPCLSPAPLAPAGVVCVCVCVCILWCGPAPPCPARRAGPGTAKGPTRLEEILENSPGQAKYHEAGSASSLSILV
jgi:hypothetical protein